MRKAGRQNLSNGSKGHIGHRYEAYKGPNVHMENIKSDGDSG